jgi:hypothetical protein
MLEITLSHICRVQSRSRLRSEGEEGSRQEAEAVPIHEAQQSQQVEDRLLDTMDPARSLPPPPSR